MTYIYSDEDNVPMNEDAFDGPHNPTVYGSRAEMKYYDSGQYLRDRDREEEENEPAAEDSEVYR